MYRPVLILMSLFLAGCAGQGLDPEKNKTKHRKRKRKRKRQRQQPQLTTPSANPLAFNPAHPAMPNAARTSTMDTSWLAVTNDPKPPYSPKAVAKQASNSSTDHGGRKRRAYQFA
jgi:hypothetical protein